ncbi:MAG TPA: NAD-dependent epimerase/dehydratase family protein [Gaiellaceae bacterium]|nr:NAD-dependent epimerase/dehydratase family protein [Gaiellaceae bacterium]
MKLLVLGGTKFLGRAVVEEALARGHEVSIFTRGETNPELFPQVERLRGDRDGDLAALEARTWDGVVDTSGYVPRVVAASAELLRDAGFYVFVSSISVYPFPLAPGYDETTAVQRLGRRDSESIQSDYGPLKAACEQVVEGIFADRAAMLRFGLIVGPHDPTDRFTYWADRIGRGGEILAPGPPERPWQFVDVRDGAAFALDVAERRLPGPFVVTNRSSPGEVLAGADVVWVDDAFLVERGVGEWMELPLWVADGGEIGALHQADTSRAGAAGLRRRPVAETVADTLAWSRTRQGRGPGTAAMGGAEGVGLASERERELLAAWHARR